MKTLSLVRALFPKWNFFDRIAFNFQLEFKIPGSTLWEPISFDQERRPFDVIINANYNLSLAQVSLLEHFSRDIQELQAANPLVDSKEVQALTSFKMLRSLLFFKLQEYELESDSVQFKIVACGEKEILDIYISDWIQKGRV